MHGQVKLQEGSKQVKLIKKLKQQSSESDQFQLQYHQIKKLGLPVNKKKLRVGNWSPQQNLVYLKFLQENQNDFISQQQRRKNKVFYRLSKILKKRTPDQCRSHHQKLQMKFEDDIQQIIKNIKRKLEKKSPELMQQQYKKMDISNKKTGVTDTIQENQKVVQIIEEDYHYKFVKKNQNQIQLQILVNRIKSWN